MFDVFEHCGVLWELRWVLRGLVRVRNLISELLRNVRLTAFRDLVGQSLNRSHTARKIHQVNRWH